MSELAETVVVPEPTPLEALRSWYASNLRTPELRLAMKHRHAMDPAVAAELKARAPGDSDEERELGLLFGLTQVAHQLDSVAVLVAGMRVEHLPPVDETPVCDPVEGHGGMVVRAVNDLLTEERERSASLEAELAQARSDLEAERAKFAPVEVVVEEEAVTQPELVSHVDVMPLEAPEHDEIHDEPPRADETHEG